MILAVRTFLHNEKSNNSLSLLKCVKILYFFLVLPKYHEVLRSMLCLQMNHAGSVLMQHLAKLQTNCLQNVSYYEVGCQSGYL